MYIGRNSLQTYFRHSFTCTGIDHMETEVNIKQLFPVSKEMEIQE